MRTFVTSLCFLTYATSAWAQAITSHSGSLAHGSSVTLTVTGAGTKTQNTQLLWDPMNGTHGNTDIEGRTPAGTRKWLISTGGGNPEPTLSNVVTRATPNRTTSVFMRQSGSIPVPTLAIGGGTTSFLNLTSASLPNRQALGNGPIFTSAWVHYTPSPGSNNIKMGRYWAKIESDSPGFMWFPSGAGAGGSMMTHNRYHDPLMSNLNNGQWHQMKHLLHWSNPTFVRFYFDNVMTVNTNPVNTYDDPPGGGNYTEGPWSDIVPNLAANDELDSYGWESQGSTAAPSSESYYLSDAYVDLGYNRVELCNAATYAGSNHCEMQPYTAWPANNGNLTITLNRGTFGAATSAYLYLCNASDVCGSGYPVTLGGTPPPTTPTGLRVLPGDVAGLMLAGFVGVAILSRRKA